MDSTFQKINLGQIAEFRNGLNYSKKDVGKGLKVIGVTDFQDRIYPIYDELEEVNPDDISISNEQFLKENDILFVRSNGNRELVGRTLIIKNIKEKISHSGFTIRLRFTEEEVNPYFHLYVFKASQFRKQLANYGGGTNISNINQSILNDIEVPFPEIEVQNRIASILSAFDDLIENNTRRIAILEEMARLIYREWFVHFKYPGHENDRLVDSGTELGDVPEGWGVKKLEDVIDLVYGTGLRKKDRVEGPYPVYGSSGIIDWHNAYYKEGPGIIVGRKGNVGTVFWEFGNFNPIDTTYYVESDLSLTYVYYNLKNQNFINNDAAVPGLSKRQANSLPVLIPDDETLEKFESEIIQIFNLIKNLSDQNEKLKETRDLLLPKLISGKVGVRC